MEDIYNDLENFNDVNLVNELKIQNAELKHKLEECISSKESLQKSLDTLSAEFKLLTTNFTSLLQISRAEIKRKSDMITMLNNEKDALIISRFNNGGRGRRNHQVKAEGRNPTNEFNRKECQRPPSETSSTDQSHKLSIVENRSVDKNTCKDNEAQRYDALPNREDYRDDSPQSGINRRLSMLAAQQFAKFSSDEEFEDMYSALEPKTKASFRDEPERGRKRSREEPQQCRAYYDTFAPLSRYPSNPESSRERFDKNRNSRYCVNDRNRDKYDFSPQPHRNKISPDRQRRSRMDNGEDRFSQRYDRPRRLKSPPERGRYQHKSRERRPYYGKDRVDYQNDNHKYNSSDHHIVKPSILDEYDEPQVKRPRVETHPEDRRQNDKFSNDHPSTDMLHGSSCQSPDYMYTEHAALNVPIREIKHTAATELDDPRVTSRKYVKRTNGNKDILCSVSSNEIDLQPVNKSLWELKKGKIPEALARKPAEISEELVSEIYMDIDKPIGNLIAEPTDVKELHEVTECVLEKDIEVENVSHCTKNENIKDKLVPKPSNEKNKEGKKLNKAVKCKIPKDKLKAVNKQNGVVISFKTVTKSGEVDTNKENGENVEKISILNKQSSTSDCSPSSEVGTPTESAKLTENKDLQTFPDTVITEHAKSCKNESETHISIQREFEHKVYSIRHIVEGDLELSDETNDDTLVQSRINEQMDAHRKHKTKQKSNKKDTSKEKNHDLEANTRKTRPKKEKVKDEISKNKFCELFGDSSSLITPEDLELATAQAQAHTAARGEAYVPVCEDAQDGINNKKNQMELLTQTPQNEMFKSGESKGLNTNCIFQDLSIPEKNNSTKAMKDNETKITKHVDGSHHSAKDLNQLIPNNAKLQTHDEISKTVGENASCEPSKKIVTSNGKMPQDDEKASEAVKKAQSVDNIQDETMIKLVKKTHNDEKSYKSVKNTQDDEKSGKSVKKTQDDDKTSKSVKRTQADERVSKPVKKTQDEKISKGDNKTQNDEKPFKSVRKTQDDEKATKSDKKTQDNEKASKSVKKKQDEKTSKHVKNTQNNENTSKHTKKTRDDKITIESDINSKKSKSNEENIIPANEIVIDTGIDRNHSMSESKRNLLHTSCNKENTDIQDMNSDMPKIFDDTLVSSKNYVNNNKVKDEKVIGSTKPKESICGTTTEEIPNLAPVIDDPGVQIVVISSGIQPSDSNLLQLNTKQSYTPIKALATSTPAKELSAQKPFSFELNGHQAESVNVKLPNEVSSSQCEADVPDVRINFYRRRKKVLKK